ncbi:hypothetical protein [Streptomyces sp. NPDC057496]|uniref:hypothetical protein n=1 Tax=Streptomyces sp. NPDC057496 TaxID=3346149 RepID=UPI0036CF52D5
MPYAAPKQRAARVPTHEEATAARNHLTAALRAAGIFLSSIYLDEREGRIAVVVGGRLTMLAAKRLADLVERGMAASGSDTPPAGTTPVEALPTELQIGDYLCVDKQWYPIDGMKAPNHQSRVLSLRGLAGQVVVRSARTVYRQDKANGQ